MLFMSESLSRLTERIYVHFQKESYLSNYLEIKQRENQGFEKLLYVITLQGFDLPNDESELDDIGNGIAKNLVAREFSHFLTTVASVVCKTTETTLDKLVETVDKGDHSIFVGEVIDAGVSELPDGRPDDATLTLKDLGEKTFYGG